jgi:hypothetical protein
VIVYEKEDSSWKLKMLYSLDIGDQVIPISDFITYSSSFKNCEIKNFRLLTTSVEPSQEFTDAHFTLDSSDSENLILTTNTDTPLSYTTFFLAISTEFSPNVAYLEIDISVCGYEKWENIGG